MEESMLLYHILVYFTEALIIFSYTTRSFTNRFSKQIYPIIYIFFSYMLAFSVSLLDIFWINGITFLLINFTLFFIFYKNSFASAIFQAIIVTVVVGVSELIPLTIIRQFTADIYRDEYHMLILAIISKFLYFVILEIVARFVKTKQDIYSMKPNIGSFILILISIISFIIMMIFISIDLSGAYSTGLTNLISTVALFILLINILSHFLYWYIQKTNYENTSIILQLQREHSDAEYNKLLLSQNEQMHILVHDIKDHLQSISSMCEDSTIDKIASYVNQLLKSSSFRATTVYCDNTILNSILSRYEQVCTTKKIAFNIDIRSKVLSKIAFEDITTIFCNILNNATEAASISDDAFIDMVITHQPDINYTIIKITNSCRTTPFASDGVSIISHKKDTINHGYGLKSIKNAVEKYDGHMHITYNDEEKTFTTSIMIKEHII